MEGQSFPRHHVALIVGISVVAACVPGLQPILLGGLLTEGRIGAASMGYAATAEALGMAVGMAIAGAWFPPRRLRYFGAAAILSVIAANLFTIFTPSAGIVAARILSGLGNGVLIWLLLGMVTRSRVPARVVSYFVIGNALVVFFLSLFLTAFAIARYGALSGYATLTCIYLVLLGAVWFIPQEYGAIEENPAEKSKGAGMPPKWGLLGLVAVLLNQAGVMALWVYLVPLGIQSGVAEGAMQMTISASVGVQIVAGLIAFTLAEKLTGVQTIIGTSLVAILAALATMLSGSVGVWAPAVIIFAFCWMFCVPFHMSFLIEADPSRRSGMFLGTAQFGGHSLGPLLVSLSASSADYGSSRIISVLCFFVVIVIAAFVVRRVHRVVTSQEGSDLHNGQDDQASAASAE